MIDEQLESLADALGLVIAEQRKEWEREHHAAMAEHRALVADLRRENSELRAELRAAADEQLSRLREAAANIKDGAPGPAGPMGPPGESIVGPQGQRGEMGSRIFVGAGIPEITGRDGDVYIDSTTGDLYQFKS